VGEHRRGAYDLEPEPIVSAEVANESTLADQPEPFFAETPFESEVVAVEEREPFIAVEPEPVAAEDIEPEPIVTEEIGAERTVAAEPEPVEPVEPVSPHRIAPISETILRFPDRQAPAPPAAPPIAAEDDTPELAARRAQLDLLGLGDPGEGPVQPTRPSVVPYRSRGATPTAGELAARAAAATGTTFWEASAREVASAAAMVGVQNCGQCGLSLSANARFCRRCGTRQAQSA
jgi:hypothetical protein